MEMLTTILFLSIIMWYIIDRIKPMWEDLSYGKYITMFVAALLAAALTFVYGLDIVYALGIVPSVTILGGVITVLLLMGGSSAVAELIGKLQK